MSQAIIDFCETLKTTLLDVEERVGKAKASLDAESAEVRDEAKRHLAEAAEALSAFRAHAGLMAEAVRAEAPEQMGELRQRLQGFGQEAQTALRHAAVFLAEAASKGAVGAAVALQTGAQQANALAEKLRHQTAVTTPIDTE